MAEGIAEFYKDKCVLITGATGFMGKVLVEKLLRSCPGLKTVYLLMRPKGTSDIRTRLEELLAAKLFDGLRSSSPERLTKLVPVQGDILQPGLGIRSSDVMCLQETVAVVFHTAATVKFDEALKLSVEMNVRGTERLLELCQRMVRLEALIHVSTAYCNCDREMVAEIVYPTPLEPNQLIQCMQWMDDDLVQQITPRLIGNRPNTYTLTKAVAEQLLVDQCGSLPVAIVRPSIVTAAWREPVPGWVDNLNGPTGMILGAGKGIMRSFLCDGDMVADLIPVDVPINLMITAAWHTATNRTNNIVVYNCTSGNRNPVQWRDLLKWGIHWLLINPFSNVFWYPQGHFKQNRLWHNTSMFVTQFLPACLADLCSWVSGKQPKLVKTNGKIVRAMTSLQYFANNQWRFLSDNMEALEKKLTPADRQTFGFDLTALHWPSYFEQYCLGVRRYILKEEMATLPHSRKALRRLFWIHQCTRFAGLLLLWRTLTSQSQVARSLWDSCVRLLLSLLRLLPLVNI